MSPIYILSLFSLYTLCLAVPFVHRTEGGVDKVQLIKEKLSDLQRALRQMELRKQNDIVQDDAVEPMSPSALATTTEDANKDAEGGIDLQALKVALDKLRQGRDDDKQEDVGTFLETPIELSSDHQKEIDLTSSSNDWKKLAQEMQKQRDELFLLNGGKWAGVVPSEDNDKLVEVLRQKEINLVENQLLGDVEKAKKLGISVNDIISDMQKSCRPASVCYTRVHITPTQLHHLFGDICLVVMEYGLVCAGKAMGAVYPWTWVKISVDFAVEKSTSETLRRVQKKRIFVTISCKLRNVLIRNFYGIFSKLVDVWHPAMPRSCIPAI